MPSLEVERGTGLEGVQEKLSEMFMIDPILSSWCLTEIP